MDAKAAMRPIVRRLLACSIAAATWATASACSAEALFNSGGFEPPTYSAGNLVGQAGWLVAGGGGSTATVQQAVTLDGVQALEVNRASSSDRFWYNPVAGPQSGRFVQIDWDMYLVPTTGGDMTTLGPFFGVQVIDDSQGGGSPFPVVAGFGVDATTGEILYQEEDTGSLVPTGNLIAALEWTHFRIELDFANDEYAAFLNGMQVLSGEGFVDRGRGIDRLTDADIVATAAGPGASDLLTGVAYVDNFLVRDGLRADYNGDGLVDAADYTVWRDNFGQLGVGVRGDGDADGEVGASDYLLWRDAFGGSNALTASTSAVTAIPEPASAVGVGCLLAGAAATTRRRGSRG